MPVMSGFGAHLAKGALGCAGLDRPSRHSNQLRHQHRTQVYYLRSTCNKIGTNAARKAVTYGPTVAERTV